MRPSFLNLHGLIITAIVFLLIGAMKLITFQSHYFDPFNNGMKDYEVTDILFSQLRDPQQMQREDRVVLVHVEKPQRADVATLLRRIGRQSPRVIGLDILFSGRRDRGGDSLLATALRETPNVVMAGNLAPYVDSLAGIPNMILSEPEFADHADHAYTNFLAGTDRTVRLFTPTIETLDGRKARAFAVALADHYDGAATDRLIRRDNRAERINFIGGYQSFLRVDGATVAEAPEEALAIFRDRIVIIGFTHSDAADAPIEDKYYTPLNAVYTGRSLPDMYGMVIHANILSMILDGNYISEVPNWITTVLIILFAYVNVLLIHRIYHRIPDTFHGVTRILQLVELCAFFFIVALLFYYFRVKIDFSVGFLALLLAYDIVMIYESLIRKRIPFLRDLPDPDEPPPPATLPGPAPAAPPLHVKTSRS